MFTHIRLLGISRPVLAGCLLGLVVVALSLPLEVRADAAQDEYNLAVGLYKQERWANAADRFRAFLKTYDKHEKAGLARLYLGLSLVNQDDFKAARDELRQFVKDNPTNSNLPQARYRIAECSYLLEDLRVARVELEAYLKDFPKDSFQKHALPYLADTQLRLNDPAAALANFDLAIERFPMASLVGDAKFGRARALEALKRDDEALAQYQALAAEKDGPRAADAQFHVGALSFERKKYPEAAAAYIELTKSFPTSRFVPAAHLNAGYAFYQSGRFAEAAVQFEAASNEKSQRVVAGYWLGLSLKSQLQYGKAAEALAAVAKIVGDQPLAESIYFQLAICERHLGKLKEAYQLFETVQVRWPSGEFADDSLHAMAEIAIESGDIATAETLLSRFAKEHPNSGLRVHSELLAGRLELSRAAIDVRDKMPTENDLAVHYEAAARRFENVVQNSTIPVTKSQARYYLALTRQLQGKHAQALEVIAPLVEEVLTQGNKSELADALILQADSLLIEKKYPEAEKAATAYLELSPQGRQAARSVAIQAIAAAQRGDLPKSDAALERLNRDYPKYPMRAATIQQLAELAEAREDWPNAAKLYEALINVADAAEFRPYALRGMALVQLKQNQPVQAAATFGRIVQEYPTHRLVLESSYYRAEALRDANQIDASIAAFDELLRKVPADKPAEAGADQKAPGLYSYRAGLQAARLYQKTNRIKEADAEYEELLKRFPKPQRLDQVLNDWAILNYTNQRFDRSDEIFRRLVKEAPESEFADNARLNLAESDLIAERLEPARQAFEELLASDKSDAEVKERALYQLLVLAVDQQRWNEVRLLANRLTTEYPASPQRYYAAYSLAEAAVANPKATEPELESARESLNGLRKQREDKEVSSFVWFDRVWVLLAEIAFRQKKYDEVEAIVAELRQKPMKSQYLYQADEILGRSYKQQAPPKFDEARKAFERVLAEPVAEKTETAAKSQFLIGETYFLQEKWAEAFLAYQKVYANYDFPEWQTAALLQSAKCDEQQQQWKDAAATYRLLLEKFPNSVHADEVRQRLKALMKMVTN